MLHRPSAVDDGSTAFTLKRPVIPVSLSPVVDASSFGIPFDNIMRAFTLLAFVFSLIGKLLRCCHLLILCSRREPVVHASAADRKPLTALQRLDRDLLEVEIYLKELDLEHTKSLAYGWREDVGTKLSEWKSSLQAAFEKLRATVRSFVSQLTTREGSALPEWVYVGFSGALEDVLRYIEKRMNLEDNGFRSALLEVLKNVVRIYRNRIAEAATKVTEKPPSDANSSGPTPAPIPAPTGDPAASAFRDIWDL